MPCSIGLALNQELQCEQGTLPDQFLSIDPLLRGIIAHRVKVQINSVPLILQDVCSTHFTQFYWSYKEYQKLSKGCCAKFHPESVSVLLNTLQITKEFSEKYYFLEYLLPERRICSTCIDALRNPQLKWAFMLNSAPMPDNFQYTAIQILFSQACTGLTLDLKLKDLQAKVVFYLLKGRDTMAVLKTNYGKTICFIAFALIKAYVTRSSSTLLIISPLNSLTAELLQRIKAWGLMGASISLEALHNNTLRSFINKRQGNHPKFLIASPEILLASDCKEFLHVSNIIGVAIDEGHLLADWSKSFRKAFGFIEEIRNFINAPFCLLTATITELQLNVVLKSAGMKRSSLEIVSDSPDRPEIFLSMIRRVPNDDEKNLGFLVDEFKSKGRSMDKTLIFVNSTQRTHELNMVFRSQLPDLGRIYENGNLVDYISDHYSASTNDKSQARIMHDFNNPFGILKVVFATTSFSLGLDNKTIRRVVLYDQEKDKKSVAPIWQKIGRCCRDGNAGMAIMRQGKGHFEPNTCLRTQILSPFIGYDAALTHVNVCMCKNAACECNKCRCCSVCILKCLCRELPNPSSLVLEEEVSNECEELDWSL